MANLKSNGTEIVRYMRADESDLDFVLRASTEISVRSNGWVLRKHTAVIIDVYTPKGYRLVTKGWLRWFKMPVRATAADYEPGWLRDGFKRLDK